MPSSVRSAASLLGLETERHVVDGLGWFEFLRFASSATGRQFLLSGSIEFVDSDTPATTQVSVEEGADAADTLRDFVETLAVDLSDFAARKEPFAQISLPIHTLWRQDDNGSSAMVATFTGLRKAEQALCRFEALHHKQTYWIESK